MFNPRIPEVIQMCRTMTDKHMGEMNWLDLSWDIMELYDARYENGVIQQLVPKLVIDFK